MPTLYRLDADAAAIGAQFGARTGEDPWAGGTISPAGFAPIVTAGREFIAGPRPAGRALEARLIPRLWGVPPPPSSWGEVRRDGIMTVRNPDSPFWIGNLRNAEFRCLVPASAFMVWGKGRDAQGRRRHHWFGCTDQPLFAMAGVWKDSEVPSFAVLTCEPNAALRSCGRDAMPVILPPDAQAWQTWLHAGWDRAQALLAPYPSSLMEAAGSPP
ncbi:SOS response-associated peptidase family protein [Novosphingobium aquimarinum]|uniref:SOS response-associated peptidase family protein n=1 Tax=Novosphingobium aquimarinum TaxID=2682494 RepID=UPI0012EC2AEF|nr:SOS response-associated peptidase family protein [Novosphingobium aquimarinum]